MLYPVGEDIWTGDGPTVFVAGFGYPTRMVVIRLSGGGLFIWSPIGLSDELRTTLDRLGPVRHVVAPNALHHLFIGEWRAVYPAATVHGLPELRASKPGLLLDSELGDDPEPNWSHDIDQVVVRGNRITSEVVFFHRRSRTVIFADLIQHFERGWFKGWRGWVARMDRLTAPEPAVPMKFRLAFTDRDIARLAIRQIMAWPIENIVMAHGQTVERGGRVVVARAFRWLLR